MRAYVYKRELGTPTTNGHNILDSEKLSQFVFLVLLVGFEPRVFGSIEPPRHPRGNCELWKQQDTQEVKMNVVL